MAKTKLPQLGRIVPGCTRIKASGGKTTIREVEHDAGPCTYCGSERKTLWSYDNTNFPYCNKDHWYAGLIVKVLRESPSSSQAPPSRPSRRAAMKTANKSVPPGQVGGVETRPRLRLAV
ncbi:hypothetical protein KBC99_02870 [Candidatus Saccharibacteria bacterium]|nr:hypothetical protein [Candidatus Saccharibacteria bacterium]